MPQRRLEQGLHPLLGWEHGGAIAVMLGMLTLQATCGCGCGPFCCGQGAHSAEVRTQRLLSFQGETTSPPSLLDSDSLPPAPAPSAPTAATAAAATPPLAARPPIPLPRTTSATSSAAAGVPAVPAPAKPPAPRGAWAQKQPAVMSVVPPPPPPPRTIGVTATAPQGAGSSAPTSPQAGNCAVPAAPAQQPAAEAQQQQHAAQQAQPKLSKSQRKNLRRAEKKASEAAAQVRSSQDDGAAGAMQGSAHAEDAAMPAGVGAGNPTTPRRAKAAAAVAPPLPPPPPPPPPPHAPPGYTSEAASAGHFGSPSSMHSAAAGPLPAEAYQHHHSPQQQLCAGPGPMAPQLLPPQPPLPGCGGPAAEGDLLDRCLQLVVQHKLQKQVESLASLGFPPSAALAAVQHHGGNLEAAITALLEQVRLAGLLALLLP